MEIVVSSRDRALVVSEADPRGPERELPVDVRHPANVTIRLAETAEDYFAFGELVREYIVSLDFEVGFQDVDHELI